MASTVYATNHMLLIVPPSMRYSDPVMLFGEARNANEAGDLDGRGDAPSRGAESGHELVGEHLVFDAFGLGKAGDQAIRVSPDLRFDRSGATVMARLLARRTVPQSPWSRR